MREWCFWHFVPKMRPSQKMIPRLVYNNTSYTSTGSTYFLEIERQFHQQWSLEFKERITVGPFTGQNWACLDDTVPTFYWELASDEPKNVRRGGKFRFWVPGFQKKQLERMPYCTHTSSCTTCSTCRKSTQLPILKTYSLGISVKLKGVLPYFWWNARR